MTSPYRTRAEVPPSGPLEASGRLLTVALSVLLGSLAVHAFDAPAHFEERARQRAWSDLAHCLVGPPLAPSETPSSRFRAHELVARLSEERDRFGPLRRGAGRCGEPSEAMVLALGSQPETAALRDRLRRGIHRIDEGEVDALFGAALALGLAHATELGRPHPSVPRVLRARDQPPFARGVQDLARARFDPIQGTNPTVLFAGGVAPRICRWGSDEEPLDRVVCWDAPTILDFDALGIDGASLEGADALLQGRSRGVFDALDGTPLDVPDDSMAVVSRREDGSVLMLALDDQGTSLQVTSPAGETTEVARLARRASGLVLARDAVWVDGSRKGELDAGFFHLDPQGRVHSVVKRIGGWTSQTVGCQVDEVRGFAVNELIAVASPGRGFLLPEAFHDFWGHGAGGRNALTCLRGGQVVLLSLEGPGRIPRERSIAERRCTEATCSFERVSLGDLLPEAADDEDPRPPLSTLTMPPLAIAAVQEEVVVVAAAPGAGVHVRRAPFARLASTPPTVLLDDLEAPTKRIHLVSDGRAAVALLDDGHAVRALRLRPDGTWVPQAVPEPGSP